MPDLHAGVVIIMGLNSLVFTVKVDLFELSTLLEYLQHGDVQSQSI